MRIHAKAFSLNARVNVGDEFCAKGADKFTGIFSRKFSVDLHANMNVCFLRPLFARLGKSSASNNLDPRDGHRTSDVYLTAIFS